MVSHGMAFCPNASAPHRKRTNDPIDDSNKTSSTDGEQVDDGFAGDFDLHRLSHHGK
jgi:hypothetical protein